MAAKTKGLTYRSAGVNVAGAATLAKQFRQLARRTHGAEVLTDCGSFAGLFQPRLGDYRQPVLVASTDGVGTKALLGRQLGKHAALGVDLVAMNVNDVLALGATPLFFLDYVAVGQLAPRVLRSVVSGISRGCVQAGCALLGGETAEMPDLYRRGEYDLAGFCVGVVERSRMLRSSAIRRGDQLIGVASSGVHANGFSLVRKALGMARIKRNARLANALMRPTRIYVKPVLDILRRARIKAVCHVTGGGIEERVVKGLLARQLPKGRRGWVDLDSWMVPAVFREVQEAGGISDQEMYRTFNMGIGLVLVVHPNDVSIVQRRLTKERWKNWVIGGIE